MTSLDLAVPATRRPHLTARTANVAIADTKCELSLPRDSRARNHFQASDTASATHCVAADFANVDVGVRLDALQNGDGTASTAAHASR